MSTNLGQIETVCAVSLETLSHVIAISEAKIQQKVDNFKEGESSSQFRGFIIAKIKL